MARRSGQPRPPVAQAVTCHLAGGAHGVVDGDEHTAVL